MQFQEASGRFYTCFERNIKMRIGLPFKGSGVDVNELTTTPPSVRKGKTFYGAGTDDRQDGMMPDAAPVNKKMALNETYNIPLGYHDGNDTFYQELPIFPGKVVTPGAGKEVVETNGKYAMGNVTVLAVSNLRPEVIKFGVVVGDGEGAVTGTWQGFVD